MAKLEYTLAHSQYEHQDANQQRHDVAYRGDTVRVDLTALNAACFVSDIVRLERLDVTAVQPKLAIHRADTASGAREAAGHQSLVSVAIEPLGPTADARDIVGRAVRRIGRPE